jgi:hypothetical protein
VEIRVDKLERVLRGSWGVDTCYPKDRERWSPDLPEVGQCFVTALIINDYLGGRIAYNKKLKHYFNILPDGTIIDLTRKQFGDVGEIGIDKTFSREVLMKKAPKNAVQRYLALKRRVEERLNSKVSV